MFSIHFRALQQFRFQNAQLHHLGGFLVQILVASEKVFPHRRGNLSSQLVFQYEFQLFKIYIKTLQDAYSFIVSFPDNAQQQMSCTDIVVSQPVGFFFAEQ